MSNECCSGCLLKCSLGVAPSALNVLPINSVFTTTPAANIMDNKPFLNILPFGMCTSPANPAVIASFGAPAPCTPMIVSPWFLGAIDVIIGSAPAFNDQSKNICMFGGMISVSFAGQIFAAID
jgi:hypothetical protein